MKITGFAAVLIQFPFPEKAYRLLCGEEQGRAIMGTAALILFIGFIPFILMNGISQAETGIPLLIAAERVILSAAAGLAVFALAYALGEKKPLWPAITSSFLSMGAFMAVIAVLTLISYIFSLPGQFSWSPAEFLTSLPATRLSVFLVLFAARLDLASLVTVYLWGRGLSTVWDTDRNTGQRLVWTVYLFGILLLTLPVFIAAPVLEGAS